MGNDIEGGVDFSDGELVTAARLDAHVQNATIKPTFISEKPTKEELTKTESLVIEDAGTLKRATIQQIIDTSNTFPVGAVVDYAGPTAPTGWLLCYGQAVDRETYADLFDAIGIVHGAGNGTTTFNLPDLRGRTVAGVGNMGGTESSRLNTRVTSALGAVGGSQSHTLVVGELTAHTHNGVDHLHLVPPHQHSVSNFVLTNLSSNVRGGSGTFNFYSGTFYTDSSGSCWTGAADRALTTSSTGSSSAHNNVQPTAELNKIIKV